MCGPEVRGIPRGGVNLAFEGTLIDSLQSKQSSSFPFRRISRWLILRRAVNMRTWPSLSYIYISQLSEIVQHKQGILESNTSSNSNTNDPLPLSLTRIENCFMLCSFGKLHPPHPTMYPPILFCLYTSRNALHKQQDGMC